MQIRFCLAWLGSSAPNSKSFKLDGARTLFGEYVERISKFAPCQVSATVRSEARKAGVKAWVCERGEGAKEFSSEELAKAFEKLMISGMRELDIVIGGADGFSRQDLDDLKPDLTWSFGRLTLPHELAAVVASEQIYRAFTIIHKTPYHLGH